MPETSDYNQAGARFVEVALPIPPRQTFTYKVPPALAERLKTGSRVLVPFGKRLVTGYAVALHGELDPELGIEPTSLKSISEVTDISPLLSEEVLSLTKWTADYYAASWGEMLKASLPAGINAAVERVVTINESGREALSHARSLRAVKFQVLKSLVNGDQRTVRDLEKEFGAAAARRAVRELLAAGQIDATDRAAAEKIKAKRRKAVRLLDPGGEHDAAATTEMQKRVLEILEQRGGEAGFVELV